MLRNSGLTTDDPNLIRCGYHVQRLAECLHLPVKGRVRPLIQRRMYIQVQFDSYIVFNSDYLDISLVCSNHQEVKIMQKDNVLGWLCFPPVYSRTLLIWDRPDGQDRYTVFPEGGPLSCYIKQLAQDCDYIYWTFKGQSGKKIYVEVTKNEI